MVKFGSSFTWGTLRRKKRVFESVPMAMKILKGLTATPSTIKPVGWTSPIRDVDYNFKVFSL